MPRRHRKQAFPTAKAEIESRRLQQETDDSYKAYKLAFTDEAFLLRQELRPIRFQLELLKPELTLSDYNIDSTIAFFGSARIVEPEDAQRKLKAAEKAAATNPEDEHLAQKINIAKNLLANSRYYDEARKLARLVSLYSKQSDEKIVVATGGGPGIMEAANRGAHDVGELSISLNIVIPKEPDPNPYVTPELSFLFHYFALRKMHFLMRAEAIVAFPGGFGTFDELFEAITLIQTGKITPIPILLFGEAYWNRVIDFDALVEEGVISRADLKLFHFVETAEQAWESIIKYCELEIEQP